MQSAKCHTVSTGSCGSAEEEALAPGGVSLLKEDHRPTGEQREGPREGQLS